MNAHSRYATALVVSYLACSLIAGCRPATNTDKPDVTDKRRTTHALLAGASPNWGLLVAPQSGPPTPIKSTYFFPGAPISGALRNWTFMPIDAPYLTWTTSAPSRAFIVGQMAQVGANAIIMSYYHTYCCAPMEQYVDAQGHSTNWPGGRRTMPPTTESSTPCRAPLRAFRSFHPLSSEMGQPPTSRSRTIHLRGTLLKRS